MKNFCRGFVCVVKSARKYFLCATMSQETAQVATNTTAHEPQLSPDAQQSKSSASCSPTAENPICDPSPQDRHRDLDVQACKYDDEADQVKSKRKKPRSPPPNSFVAVRIPSAEIRGKIKVVQDAMLEKQKKAKSTFVSLDKLHITLMVLRIDDEDTLERAKLALHKATRKVAVELTEPLLLEFSGVGSFGKNVLFALIKEGAAKEKLSTIADVVRSTFESHALPSTDPRNFNPHLTIAKVSRNSKVRGIEPELYSELADTEFGMETITCLELLSMSEPPTDDGYYHCFERYSFDGVGST